MRATENVKRKSEVCVLLVESTEVNYSKVFFISGHLQGTTERAETVPETAMSQAKFIWVCYAIMFYLSNQ